MRGRTGAPVEVRASLGSTVAFDALARDEIDAYVEYTGTIWATLMGRTSTPGDRTRVLAELTQWLEATHGVGVAARLGFENAYAFAMPRAQAQRLGVRRLSDLIPHASRLRAGGDYEFWSRSEWRDVRAAYGLDLAERRSMDPALMYTAIEQGQVDLISAFSSDCRLAALDLVTLEDDRGAIPPYDAVVLVGRASPARPTRRRRRARRARRTHSRRADARLEPGGGWPGALTIGRRPGPAERPPAPVSPTVQVRRVRPARRYA